eukprot:TRINITY_DN80_c0_g1_i1.p1 TRINITY_DN80_c0_g1~~TRINITY_DN80_c0_g1_i1.p1  ORF type:complete len:260 (+),score=102.56 TRINITY_DN80_c0_g1_i1:142-921(+)
MARLGHYEEEFLHICATLRLKMKQVTSMAGERKKLAVREAEREMEEADDILRQMGTYARQQNASGAQAKLKGYEADLARLRRDFSRAVRSGAAQRDELFDGADKNDMTVRSLDQRSALLADRRTLDDGVDRLKNTRAVADRTEQIGASILGNLEDQRASLIRADDALSNTDQHITRGRRILRAMDRRVASNKLILVLIALFLACAIMLVVYLKWLSPNSPIPSMTTTTTTTTVAPMTTTTATTTTTTTAPTSTTMATKM